MVDVFAQSSEGASETVYDTAFNVSDVIDVVAGDGLTKAQYKYYKVIKVRSSTSGACDISANPQIEAPTLGNPILEIHGSDDTRTVQFDNGNGLALVNGSVILGDGDVLILRYIDNLWKQVAPELEAVANIDNTVYGVAWNGSTNAPTQDRVYDKIEALDGEKSDIGHTHSASDVTDFDTEVSNNSDVAANTSARHTHSNQTVLDNTTASFTTSDETKLDGIEALADVTDAGNIGSSIHGASAKTTPVDADTIPLIDSAASNVLKKVTWANIKATLKAYFDTLYQAAGSYLTASSTDTLTNKTIDANGTGNSITNLEVADFASGVIDTDLTSVAGTDTTIPSAKATKTALDLKAPLSSPTFTGTVTLPTGLTGVIRADSGVVSVDSDVTDVVASASDITAGKVELATTAETTTGTDTTRAVTPDGLHDMTSLAGAAWFLDEDDMASNSATKTVSQQSLKAYVDTEIAGVSAGSGITRTVVVTSGSVTMGSTAATDYAYFVAGAHTLSMPSPNANRYTVKNNHSAAITIDTAGAETIEGVASISVAPADSVDIVSDGTNWFIV